MPVSLDPWAVALLGAVTLERLAELALARANTARLRRAGGIEVAAGHYPWIVALHTGWLGGLWWLAADRPPEPAWTAVFLLLQLMRLWVLATLGRRWTTRIIIVPGETLVRKGPYRLLRHPNYAVVVAEILILPLAFGLPVYALVFTLLNALLLAIRIPAEERALAQAVSTASRIHGSKAEGMARRG
jgi:methyltransferase